MSEYSKVEIHVLPDLEAISYQAASLFVSASRNAITERTRFAVAISGGSTPRKLYGLLGSEEYTHQIDWQRVHFFWVDERCVHREHEESNFKMGFDAFLSKISTPDGNIHRIKGEEPPGKAAREYQEELQKFFGGSRFPVFDLIILGVGEDGHTASLFPGSEALGEKVRWVVPIYLEKPKINRVTLTVPVLKNAAQILFLVSGRSKATVLSEILVGNHKNDKYPASLIRPVLGDLIWLIDQQAADQLISS